MKCLLVNYTTPTEGNGKKKKKPSSDTDHLGLLVLTARLKAELHGLGTPRGEGRRVPATPSTAIGNTWQGRQIKVSETFRAGVLDTSTTHTDACPVRDRSDETQLRSKMESSSRAGESLLSLIFPSFPLQQDLHLPCKHNPSADNKTALQPPRRGSTLAKAAVRDPELYGHRVEHTTGSCQLMLPAASCKFAPLHCSLRWGQRQGSGTSHLREGNLPLRRKFWGRPAVGGEGGGGGVVVGSAALPLPRARTMPFFCRTKVEPFTRLDTTATLRPSDTAAGPGPGPGPGLCAAPSAAIRIAPADSRWRWRRRSARPALPAPAPPGGGRAARGTRPEIGEGNGEKRGCDGSTMTSWQLPLGVTSRPGP